MNTYKITNITNSIAKRDIHYNTTIDIEYVVSMSKKIISIKPGNSVFLTIPSLPISIQRMKIKKMITVTEMTPLEMDSIINSNKPKINNVDNYQNSVKYNDEKLSQVTKKKK